jgi:cell wall-associated NlpC family hydrolase
VDNSSERFEAPGWKTGDSGLDYYGEDYSVAGEGTESARFKVKVPATGVYSVYAWWHAEGGNDSSARFGVSTPEGVRWTEVNQRKDGGFWVKLGQYEMKKGDRYAVQVAPGSGEEGTAVADAVAVVRGVTSAPPDDSYDEGSEGSSGLRTTADRGSRPNGRDVVRRARSFQGTSYKYATCIQARMSCTCLTGKSFRKFGIYMSMSEGRQWSSNRGNKIQHRRNLQRGDHVFFREHGPKRRITHVGVYSGNGNIVHASSYFGKVVESRIKYINGFAGAKRYHLR